MARNTTQEGAYYRRRAREARALADRRREYPDKGAAQEREAVQWDALAAEIEGYLDQDPSIVIPRDDPAPVSVDVGMF